MNSEIGMLITEIDANLSHVESLTHGLTNEHFNWRPAPGRWSMAECIAHLNVVNGGDLAPIQAAVAGGRSRGATGEGPFEYGFLSKKFVASMEPPVKRKFKAPKYYVPAANADMQQTLAEYGRISGELRKIVRSADGLHLGRIKTVLPALPVLLRMFIRMPLGARLALIGAHDRRHLWQAEQVRNDPAFPASRSKAAS